MEIPSKEEIEFSLEENVRQGFMEITGVDQNGDKTFRLTESGEKFVEQMLKSDPEMRDFYISLAGKIESPIQ